MISSILRLELDETGNAIIDFGNDCNSAAGKVKELLQSEQDATFIEATTEKFLINI